MISKRKEIEKLIEPFIFNKLKNDEYKVKNINASELLTWNRFDLAFKLFYLNYKNVNYDLALKIYKEDIKAQTLGEFVEIGNEDKKNSFQPYIDSFDLTYNDIAKNGFDDTKTLVPLSKFATIINGSHRVSSAIYLNKKITCIKTEQENMIADYRYFYERDVSIDVLDLVARKFIEFSNENTYIAFLWPSGKDKKDESESKFSNIVYKKELKLTYTGGLNLLIELYKHMDWVGTEKNGFQGAKQKLIECFPAFDKFTVIVFQEDNLEKVREIKEEVRQIHNIGFSSVHITDTKEEAIRISNLIFNDNGIHFLNYANPYKYTSLYSNLEIFKYFLQSNNVNSNEVLIDGSVTLSLYGLRKNDDIDYLILDNQRIKEINTEYKIHDTELKYHELSKSNLIYNSKYYFEYLGFRFTSFSQLYKMKKKRNEEKDKNDCAMMESLMEKNQYGQFIAKMKQSYLYFKIKANRRFRETTMSILKFLKLYEFVRFIYKEVKGKS